MTRKPNSTDHPTASRVVAMKHKHQQDIRKIVKVKQPAYTTVHIFLLLRETNLTLLELLLLSAQSRGFVFIKANCINVSYC